MPPGSTLSSRRRKSRPCSATGSLARSVLARTMSVTPFGPCDTIAWPLPSGTRLSAGHSPAKAEIENAAASAAAICVSFMVLLLWVGLMGSPAAFNRQHCAGDGSGLVRAEKRRQRGHFLHGHELLGRLGGEQHIADDGFLADAARPGGVRNLPLHERRQHVARAHRVHGDALLR